MVCAGSISEHSSDNRYKCKPYCSENGDRHDVAYSATLCSVGKGPIPRWVQAAADRVGGQARLAEAITERLHRPFDRSKVNKMCTGDRGVKADEMVAIEAISGLPAPKRSAKVPGLPLLGKVAAGVWKEIVENQDEPPRRPVAPDPRYPEEAQFLLEVEGQSINKIAAHGSLLTCVDLHVAGLEPRPRDLVVVRRRRGALLETTVKRLQMVNGALELWPESNDPAHQEKLSLRPSKAESVEIQAIVIWATSPVARGD